MLSATAETGNIDLTFFFFLTDEDGSSDTDENLDEITIITGNDFIQKRRRMKLGDTQIIERNGETIHLWVAGE